MPIIKSNPEQVSSVIPNEPRVQSPKAQTALVDTKYVPLGSLITFIAGHNWTIDYYSQQRDKDNDLAQQDVGQSALNQTYLLVKGMNLKVQSPLTQQQDAVTKRTTVVGTAAFFPFIIPNEGDMFVADAGDGRDAVFKVKTTEKKSFLKQASYLIDYELVYFSDADPAKRQDLTAKTIRTLFYRQDFATYGQNPLLIEEDYDAIQRLEASFGELAYNYMKAFFHKKYMTLIIPGQALHVYDPFVAEVVQAVLDTNATEEMRYFRRLNTGEDEFLKEPTIMKALMLRDKSVLDLSNKVMGLCPVKQFARDPSLEAITYSGVAYTIYPTDMDISRRAMNDIKPKVTTPDMYLTPVFSRAGALTEVITMTTLEEVPLQLPLIKNIDVQGSYVFGAGFYLNAQEESVLEVLVNAYFDRKAIDPKVLLKVVTNYRNWGGLEQFYYIPIILMLIRATVRTV